MSGSTNRFSAPGPALGYLAQIEYALLVALQRMEADEDLRFSLETVDDIVFDSDGQPAELWQTKHHAAPGTLGDSSPDLWKSLHNWIETAGPESACFLFTTSVAAKGTAARMLRSERTTEDLRAARAALDRVARAAKNAASAQYYDRYLALTEAARGDLLRRVTVLDGAVDAQHLTSRLIRTVRKATRASRREPLVERLRGWWHGRAMAHLSRIAQGEEDWIEIVEIEDRLLAIAQSLRDDNLPLDYDDADQPSAGDVKNDERVFVEQLRLIMLHHDRIRQAIYDHNRAFLQRSRWQREHLVGIGELEAYDRRLVEEWARAFAPVDDDVDSVGEREMRQAAKQRYFDLQQKNLPEIRTEVRSGYIPFGSLHLLADRMEIGWHPKWVDLLRHRLGEAQGTDREIVA